jgi:hypothetical protein
MFLEEQVVAAVDVELDEAVVVWSFKFASSRIRNRGDKPTNKSFL